LEVFEGRRLVDRGLEALRGFCSPVLLVVNELKPFWTVRATLIRDVIPHQGPLGGLHTALLFSPHEWVAVRATDMPFFVPEMLERMLALRAGADAVVPRLGDKFEPLFALYHRRCLPAIVDVLEGSQRNVISMYRKVHLATLDEEEWRLIDPEGLSFRNVNTPEDWKSF
jgi:molybdopterin-guanine dinucleotide biosynthesis protein A